MEERPALLFCDTFVHEGEDDIRLDMIGFSRPVSISEIRVIPQGCKVHPEIRDRLGETSPSSFKLELFIKNLTKPNATVFEVLGILDYEQGKSIQQIVNSQVATNVVLVRGWYRNITVSLYGTFSNFTPDPTQVPPPPPMDASRNLPVGIDTHVPISVPPSISHTMPNNAAIPPMPPIYIQASSLEGQLPPNAIPTHLEPVGYGSPCYGNLSPNNNERREMNNFRRGIDQRIESNDEGRRGHDDEPPPPRGGRREYYVQRNNDENYSRERNPNRSNNSNREEQFSSKNSGDMPAPPIVPSEELFEPLSPETDFFDAPQDEVNGKKISSSEREPEQIGYEDIESDEDDLRMLDDFDFDDNMQHDFDTDETWASISLNFNPYQCSFSSLSLIVDHVESEFDKIFNNFKSNKELKEPSQVKQLQDYIVSDSEAERDSKWVTMLEELPSIIPTAMGFLHSQPSQKIKERHFLSIIAEWAVFGLNMDNALTLPLAVNIRFLKASLKLTCLLASSCNEYQRALIEMDVQERLIELLKTSHMASSLKLLILKALDETTNTAFGMENFLGWNIDPNENDDGLPSVYEELLLYLLTKPTVRIITSIQGLLSKAHFYESLSALQSISGKISESPIKVLLEEADEKLKEDDSLDGELKQPKKSIELDISDKDVSNLIFSLQNIHKVIEHGNSLILLPSLQSFPTTVRLQVETLSNCFPTIIKLFNSRRFLESMIVLVSSPLLCDPGIYLVVRNIIFLLISTNHGLLYLTSHPHIVNALARVLLQSSEAESDLTDSPSLSQCLQNDDIAEGCTPHHLGLMLVYHLQTLQCIDQLLQTSKRNLSLAELDSTEHISILHTLYAMTYATAGRDAVTSTLSHGHNLKCLLPFLTGDEDFETKMKKSVSIKYAAVLLSLTLQHSEQLEYLETFGTELLAIPKKENDRVMEDIHSFLAPLEKVTSFDIHSMQSLIDFITSEVEDIKIGSGATRSILISLRLLKRFVRTTENKQNPQKDLIWRTSVIQMFSSNAMGTFISVFHKIAEQLLAPWKLNEPFSSNQSSIFVTTTSLLLELTDILLTHLLSTPFCFKDGRLPQELFSLHKILCSKPPAGPLTCILTTIQERIIELLIKFMKGTSKAPESEEAVMASTWYILLKELLVFSVAKPENFVTGLVLLSELLPTPLPIHTLHDINNDELSQVINHRLFAMANFSCLSSELKLMLRTVIASCSSTLQYYLRRVMCQLIDLGSSVSGLVIRTLCELVDEVINKANKDALETPNTTEPDLEQVKKTFLPWTFYNTFSLLSYLACQPSGKAAFLNLLSTSRDSVTEFPDFIEKLVALQQKENSTTYLETSLLPLLQSICDHEVCLEVYNGQISLQHLSNSLPSEKTMTNIVEFLLSLIGTENISIHVVIRSMNVLESLTDHDFGMIILKQLISAKSSSLTHLLHRLVTEVEKKADNKSDLPFIFNAISTFIEFLNLTNSPGPESYMKAVTEELKMDEEEEKTNGISVNCKDEQEKEETKKVPCNKLLQREVFIDANMLKTVFDLDDKNINEHALTKLEKLIEDEGHDDEELVSLSQAITTLRMIMIAGEQKLPDGDADKQIETLPPDLLQTQFNSRLTSLRMNTIHDDRASNNDWFDAAAPDEIDSDNEVESVKIDLLAIAEKFLPNFKYQEEIDKGFIDTSEIKRSRRSKRSGFFKAGDHIEDVKRRRFDVSALTGQQTTRNTGGRGANRGATKGFFRGGGFNRGFNRGFGRGRGFNRGRGRGGDVDMFRQRRQNTSRPPSMHVDDFINMEKTAGEAMIAHSAAPEVSGTQTTSAERFTNSNFANSQTRWNNNQTAGFRRPNNNETIPTIQTSRNGPYDYNNSRLQYGVGKFHNRTGSDWSNSNYRGSRDSNYTRAPSVRGGGGGGGYWAGPKTKDNDNRFFSSNNYRQFSRGGRHQRTFTR